MASVGGDGGAAVEADVVPETLPGYEIPGGYAQNSEDEFRAWVNNVHPQFEVAGVANELIRAGYDSLLALDFSAAELISGGRNDPARFVLVTAVSAGSAVR